MVIDFTSNYEAENGSSKKLDAILRDCVGDEDFYSNKSMEKKARPPAKRH